MPTGPAATEARPREEGCDGRSLILGQRHADVVGEVIE